MESNFVKHQAVIIFKSRSTSFKSKKWSEVSLQVSIAENLIPDLDSNMPSISKSKHITDDLCPVERMNKVPVSAQHSGDICPVILVIVDSVLSCALDIHKEGIPSLEVPRSRHNSQLSYIIT